MATTEETRRTEPVQVRDHLVEVLQRDLVGAEPDEVLSVAPSRWYLTGFLVPREAPIEVREDPEPEEGLASGGDDDGDDAAPPEVASARKALFPSSIGLSVLVPATTRALSVRATWGEYLREDGSVRPPPEGAGLEAQAAARPPERWRRSPGEGSATLVLPTSGKATTHALADGVNVVLSVRRVPEAAGVEKGARAVSAFLVNDKPCAEGAPKDQAFLFQASLELHTEERFLPRPNVRGQGGNDPDEQIAELQYRDVFEHAVGHGVAAEADVVEGRPCTRVRTTWLPTAEVEKVAPGEIPGVALELGMEALAEAA